MKIKKSIYSYNLIMQSISIPICVLLYQIYQIAIRLNDSYIRKSTSWSRITL